MDIFFKQSYQSAKIKSDFNRMLANSRLVLNLRVLIFGLATCHHVFMLFYCLRIDFEKSEDPNLWYYSYNKYNIITGWVNLILLVYYPVSCYCDWRSLRNEGNGPLVKKLNKIRDLIFISLLFPTIMFVDTLFWRLWLYDRELICPKTIDVFMPFWTQHSLHTLSLVVGLLELVLVPRERPVDDWKHRRVTVAFSCFYLFVCFINYLQGIYVYTLIRIWSNSQLFLLCAWIVAENVFFYHAQWHISDWLWGRKNKVL